MKAEILDYEGRSLPRFRVKLPIEYWSVDGVNGHTARTANVSEEGVLIFAPEPIKIGKNLRLKIFFSFGSNADSIEALGEVVWKDADIPNDGHYRIGVKYVGISPEDMNKLRSFLNVLASSNK